MTAFPLGQRDHVQLVHRPGERALARLLLEALGRAVTDAEGPSGPLLVADGGLWVCEVPPDQWVFERALQPGDEGGPVDATRASFLGALDRRPDRHSLIGVAMPSLDRWETALGQIRALAEDRLAGRVHVAAVHRDDPLTCGAGAALAFVRTDLISSGLLTLGQTLALHHAPREA